MIMPHYQCLIDKQNDPTPQYGALGGPQPLQNNPVTHSPRQGEALLPAPIVARYYQAPKTYLLHAILSSIFCCFVLGIPAVYFSLKARRMVKSGKIGPAQSAALKTRQLVQMAVSIGMIIWFLSLVIAIATSKH